jgi:hypothetical protein
MVCRFMGLRFPKFMSDLLDHATVTYAKWIDFPSRRLYDEIYEYNTFRSMVVPLLRPEANDAVDLLRCRFLGSPGDVTVLDKEQELEDLLTAEGVLRNRDLLPQTYSMTSDGLLGEKKSSPVNFGMCLPTEPPFYKFSMTITPRFEHFD